MRRILLALIIIMCVRIIFGQTIQTNQRQDQLSLEIDMLDGSHIIGSTSIENISIETSYANMTMPLKLIRNVIIEKDGNKKAIVNCKNGDIIKGTISLSSINLIVSFGNIQIPIENIRQLSVLSNKPSTSTQDTKANNESIISLHLDNKRNCVIVDPQRVKSPSLPPGKYHITLEGEGVRQGFEDKIMHYAFIVAYEKNMKDITLALSGEGDNKIIDLPHGGIISAFLVDSYSYDNSGSVDVKIQLIESYPSSNIQIVTPSPPPITR